MNTKILLALVAAATILLSAWYLNGSELEDAWLYLTGLWIIIISGYDVYKRRK